jgi:predicted ATP-grasp superfamily ATP-dependent carboligase
MADNLLIFGASTRAAAFSALRAGLRPWCADLFADADLETRCSVLRLRGRGFPHDYLDLVGREIAGPWMYTGALENHAALVNLMAGGRTLWGNSGDALRGARSPRVVANLLAGSGLPSPRTFLRPDRRCEQGRWLVKPLHSAGGAHIRFWNSAAARAKVRRAVYWQEYIEGEPCAAVYVGDGRQARLLGVTRQLIGESWLHAAPFHYGGSVGPLDLALPTRSHFDRLGAVLAARCGLRGLFGVDCQLREGVPWTVEINPRYSASVEVHEYATGIRSLRWHRGVFDGRPSLDTMPAIPSPFGVIGKAILFARESLCFPQDGPWLKTLRHPCSVEELPAFADVPHAGETIDAGRPVLTFFARGGSVAACLDQLRQTATDLDQWLFGK